MRLRNNVVFLCGILSFGFVGGQDAQSDVQAPAYAPKYLKNRKFTSTKTAYSGTKSRYTGTKTVYSGTKTGYSGTKNGYSGTKSAYGETKSWDTGYGHRPTYEDFQHNANQPYAAKCVPECKNNGICVATNTCHCPAQYRGKYCEFEHKPCVVYPPLPANSRRNCSSDFCTIKCMDGHKFIDGSSVANMRCVDGQWTPTRADLTSIPDCQPQCSPPCANGGACLALNTCQCPEEYRGPHCQYPASVCDVRKLAFNGGYSCSGDAEKFSCRLNCPAGAAYSAPRADLYTCQYSTGVFQPQPIPHCVFDNAAYIVAPSNYHNSSSYYESHTWQTSSENRSISVGGYGSGGGFVEHGKYGPGAPATHVVVQDFTPKGGTCLTWAGVHYKTFDGKIYSFKSQCRHILVRDAQQHKYTVAVRPGNCTRRAYCPAEITVYLEEKPYTLSVHPEDGSVVFRSSKRLIPIPASLPGIRVAMPADYVQVNLDAAGIALKWDTNDVIVVEGSVVVWNNTEGLCGTLNGNSEDDLWTKERTRAKTTTAMAASWQLNTIQDKCDSGPSQLRSCTSQSDEDKRKAQQFCTKIFGRDKFRKCSKVMDVSLLLEACQGDYCTCLSSQNPEECACSTVSVYAQECLRHGVQEMKYWRDPETCPKTCPDGKLYKVCGPDTQATCAFPDAAGGAGETAGQAGQGGQGGSNATCVEGCFCPPGLLLEAGRCVPRDQCPCRLRNKAFPPGAVIPKDCNKCTCVSGSWTCTQAACGARCSGVGDPHYATFDGRRYDFMGRCTYTLLAAGNLTVEVDNVACEGAVSEAMNLSPYKGEGRPSCTKAVKVIYGGANIHLKQGGLILVNGEEVSALPVTVGGVIIRPVSSLFVIVQLPFKVDIWWDGSTRVFVDVPASFQGKTKGLCGTFNLNQKDDFLTPEGDVEQSTLAFANKWKTREFCDDLDVKEPEHPCKANIENKLAAEKYCSKLKSKIFEECHWYVDVEAHYEACLYDMCACTGAPSRCLCPVLGDYGMQCARAGVMLQWRYSVKECELQCSGGQEYTVCADSCMRTCADVALAAADVSRCRPSCVEGCACPAGQVLENNVCVPQGLCPCNHKGMKFDAGYKEVRPGRRERELCTCVGARWECVPATEADIQKYPPAEDLRANCSAAQHMEFTSCAVAEPLTCKNMHLAPSTTTAECRPGCQCKKGYVLDVGTRRCVEPAQCPCHHGGQSYPDGHRMDEECNQCVCTSGQWSCSQRACAGTCGAWGDSHVTTFDGADYDFEGVCTYLLAKGVMDSSDGFDVEIQNVPCGTTGATCSKTATLKIGGGGNQEVVSLTKDAPLPDTSKLKRIKLRVAGAYVFLDVPSLGVTLQWDRELRVYVRIDPVWKGRVKGLCGNYNGDTRDDFQTPSGGGLSESSPVVFADSWKLKQTCPKSKPVTDYCEARPSRKEWAVGVCGALKRHPMSLCAREVPPERFVRRCERDACACDAGDDCRCACAALAAYAAACAARGIPLRWRTPHLCPMQCDEECSNYDSCVSPCPLETCDNTQDYADITAVCKKEPCVEGCKPKKSCPEGEVYSNSSLSECVARSKCRPVCMTLPDGRQVLEGEILEQDACHECRCSQQQRVCSGQPCTTAQDTTVATSPRPQDEGLKCVIGWSPWISRHVPRPSAQGQSIEEEPLPALKDMPIGSPMCNKDMMTNIECRTRVNHESPKQTGLDVECSLEKGLLCRESTALCPDFEIRVHCECEPFQCLNSTRPSHPHPEDCAKFYECTPDPAQPGHAVLKSCGPGTLYNPNSMVCDWPAAVVAVRPECDTATSPIPIVEASTSGQCAAGQVFRECVYRCDQLCDYHFRALNDNGQCAPGQKCIGGCVDKSIADKQCGKGFRWRDAKTCVPEKDCTCYSNGTMVKPGGVVVEGCVKCQCLDNQFHCDSSECHTTTKPRLMPLKSTEPPTSTTTTTTTTTTSTTTTTQAPTTTAPTTVTPIFVKNTASPPPECAPEGYKFLLWGEDAEPGVVLSASSVASSQFEPEFAVLDGRPNEISAGSWNPKTNDKNQYIQVELPRVEPVYGVVVQGSPLFDQFVTSYRVDYSEDGRVFSHATTPDHQPAVYRGPIDHTSSQRQMFSPPFEAKVVRLLPLTWHEEIAVRLDLIGCGEPHSTTPELPDTSPEAAQCDEPLGLAGSLPVDNIEVSSDNDARDLLRLDAPGGWRPLYSTPGEWIMFDFTSPRNITGVRTKGGPKGWVTSYKVMYTSDLRTFNPVLAEGGEPNLFPANFDRDSEVLNKFRLPIHARYLKVLPAKWHDAIEMRVEPVGCFEPYPVPLTTPSAVEVSTQACNVCPGVTGASCCSGRQYFDGEECVSRDQCPCVIGHLTYEVGSSFRGDNCDECMCKLGGITDCRPVKECKCAPSLVPKLVSKPSCECVCSPCPNGTRVCPTSHTCLELSRWCDGLQDCPDDELHCSTTSTSTTTTTVEPVVITTVAPTVAAVATTVPTTTVKPVECPVVQCPPGYMVRLIPLEPPTRSYTQDIPPPRPRYSYQRYYRGGTKSGFSKGGFSKGGFSKGGFSKGGFNGPPKPGGSSQAFTLDKPKPTAPSAPTGAGACQQFRCIPQLPRPPLPGSTAAPAVCSVPQCPPQYALRLDSAPLAPTQCPQYSCVPPPSPPAFCNITGRAVSTFDGAEHKYDLCYHVLARDTAASAWAVLIRKKCRLDGCQNELILQQDDQLIKVKPSLMVEYQNYEYTVEQTAKICFQKNSFDVARLGNGVVVKSRKYNFTVLFNSDGDIKIGVSRKYTGSVDGICGFFDGSPHNDRRLPGGAPAAGGERMARAWARPGLPEDACRPRLVDENAQKRAWDLCDVVTKEPLFQCGKVLNLDKWRSICLEKMCECRDEVVNGTKRTEEQCRCLLVEKMVAECLAAATDIDISAWRILLKCPAECPAPLVHYDCYRRRCEPECSSVGTQRSCDAAPGLCFPGCYCPAGTLRRGDRCVTPDQCLDCECKGVGTPADYTTFDGDTFPFLGNCTYLVSRDRNESGVHKYQVYATNGACEHNQNVTCTEAIYVVFEKNVVHIAMDPGSKKLITTVGTETVYKFPMKKDWVTINQVNGVDVNVALHYAHVEVTVRQAKMEVSVRVPSSVYADRGEGLCGSCASKDHGLRTSNGTITEDFEEFGESWEASPLALEGLGLAEAGVCGAPPAPPPCSPPPPAADPCLRLLDADIFGQCHALVDPTQFVESCQEEQCALHEEGACRALQLYAAACSKHGICPRWRREVCMPSCKEPFVYRECVECERTCENYASLEKDPGQCREQPVEGCFCPEGKVRVNNTCIEPTKCFPCDAEKQHYAGDEWQEDACKKCSCTKAPGDKVARVACTTQACAAPVCPLGHRLVTGRAPGHCCPRYTCVPEQKKDCKEPKEMECGFGQVRKQKTMPNGCKEYACECKPASECEPLPSAADVEVVEAGMERAVDRSGCCPRVTFQCRPSTCPRAPACNQPRVLHNRTEPGACCPRYSCEIPKDKCLVSLDWEASPNGGEKPRAKPEEVLKDIEESWADGPCRVCRCEASAGGTATHCATTECPVVADSTESLVVEPRPVPYSCCPALLAVACRHDDAVYKPGQNWTSPTDPCQTYACVENAEGKLEKLATVLTCDTACQPGWEYFPSEQGSGQCCGKCKPVACVVGGELKTPGHTWTSSDYCTNYTCVDLNGTMQVQSSNESCAEIPVEMKKQYVYEEVVVAGQCCKKQKAVACRDGNKIYQEGQTWRTSNPCKNATCVRAADGQASIGSAVETCDRDCARGWAYEEPAEGVCCGRCRQRYCVVEDQLKEPGSTWQSADNCTQYSCDSTDGELTVTAARTACPDVSHCAHEDLVNETCCVVCHEKPQALSRCAPSAVSGPQSIGAVRTVHRSHGACANDEPLRGFYECRGSCDSGTLYNNVTGSHDSSCECCQATQYRSLDVWLACADGTRTMHRVATPQRCACARCGGNDFTKTPSKNGGTKNGGTKSGGSYVDSLDYDIPEIYQRMKLPDSSERR